MKRAKEEKYLVETELIMKASEDDRTAAILE